VEVTFLSGQVVQQQRVQLQLLQNRLQDRWLLLLLVVRALAQQRWAVQAQCAC
jgi:hypothetical protein